MPLRGYRPPRKDIAGVISVRGLTLNDLSLLMTAHLPSLTAAFESFERLANLGSDSDVLMAQTIMRLVLDAPVVAGDIIAIAADEPEANVEARSLPFPVQVAALTEIAKLTFEMEGGLGNFLAALESIGRGMGISLDHLMSRLRDSRKANTTPTVEAGPESGSSDTTKG